MKTKIILISATLSALVVFDSCKSKESAYKAAYEAAKQKEVETVDEVVPVEKPQSFSMDRIQKEKVTVLEGAIKQYNVVIGSFSIKTNAVKEKERREKDGYMVSLAQNSNGMYRVIIASFDDKASAAAERDRIKDKYYPEYKDAWILDNN
ncbi:MAG: SPOR domain-containing protein [Dysgonamonadaceae bacterium]|jgi:cell division protein FtsN|nr:SPOR domain-containing protein [Dysgonamonadaceae bacterium]